MRRRFTAALLRKRCLVRTVVWRVRRVVPRHPLIAVPIPTIARRVFVHNPVEPVERYPEAVVATPRHPVLVGPVVVPIAVVPAVVPVAVIGTPMRGEGDVDRRVISVDVIVGNVAYDLRIPNGYVACDLRLIYPHRTSRRMELIGRLVQRNRVVTDLRLLGRRGMLVMDRGLHSARGRMPGLSAPLRWMSPASRRVLVAMARLRLRGHGARDEQ